MSEFTTETKNSTLADQLRRQADGDPATLDLSIEDCDNILFCIDHRRTADYDATNRLSLAKLETKIVGHKISLGMKGKIVFNPAALGLKVEMETLGRRPVDTLAEEDKIAQGMTGKTFEALKQEVVDGMSPQLQAETVAALNKLKPPKIMSFEEWMDSTVAADKAAQEHWFWKGICSLVRPAHPNHKGLNLLLWARYVARQCGVRGFGYGEGVSTSRSHPFQFRNLDFEMKFTEIVGKERLAEIRKLFY